MINTKNNDNKGFLWCHLRHLNPLKIHPERITKADKKWLLILNMKVLSFLLLEKLIVTLKKKNVCVNVFCYENNLVYPVHISDQKFKGSMDFLLITDENKSRYVYIKDFNRFVCNKTKCRN